MLYIVKHIEQATKFKKDSQQRGKRKGIVLKNVCINMVHDCQQEQYSTMLLTRFCWKVEFGIRDV